jgi:protein phosphatase
MSEYKSIGPEDNINPEIKHPEVKFEVGSESIAKNDPNEDTMLIDRDLGLYAVFDGAGGHAGGAEASSKSKSTLTNIYKLDKNANLHDALNETSDSIEMGFATAAVVRVVEGSESEGSCKVEIATVGDSRVYIVDSKGNLRSVSIDNITASTPPKDRLVARLKQEKLSNVEKDEDLTTDEHIAFSRRNIISSSLGVGSSADAFVYEEEIRDGDYIIITSDGIHDNLTDKEIISHVDTHLTSEEIAGNLAKAAKDRSADGSLRSKIDDTSVIVMKYESNFTPSEESKYSFIEEEPPRSVEKSKIAEKYLRYGDSIEIPVESTIFPINVKLAPGINSELELSLKEISTDNPNLVVALPGKTAGEYRAGKFVVEIPSDETPRPVIIGRDQPIEKQLGVRFSDYVSRTHISLEYENGKITIKDTSTNGTLISG